MSRVSEDPNASERERMADLAYSPVIVLNHIADPTYAPYCGRCSGLHRMKVVEPFLWNHMCGAVHDERHVLAARASAETGAATPNVLDRLIVVCDQCLRACCWQGTFMCDDAVTAGTKELPVRVLNELQRGENAEYWFKDEDGTIDAKLLSAYQEATSKNR